MQSAMPDPLTHWLSMAIDEAEPINTAHLNTLDVGWSHSLRGAEIMDICLAVFDRAHQHLQTLAPDAPYRRLVLYLPLGQSSDLILWSGALWTNLGEDSEPPSLYVLNDAAVFDELVEEYFTRVCQVCASSIKFCVSKIELGFMTVF